MYKNTAIRSISTLNKVVGFKLPPEVVALYNDFLKTNPTVIAFSSPIVKIPSELKKAATIKFVDEKTGAKWKAFSLENFKFAGNPEIAKAVILETKGKTVILSRFKIEL